MQEGSLMKELNMLIWITQLGMSVAVPLAGFTLLGLWLRDRFCLGIWAVLVCCAVGFICAINGLRHSLKMMEQMDQRGSRKKEKPPVSYNDHE